MSQDQNSQSDSNSTEDPAVNIIRAKINSLYDSEPKAAAEVKEIAKSDHKLSKHQQYMKRLSDSGDSLADIQTKWHEYYVKLPDNEKHEVWQEFYSANNKSNENKKNQDKPTVHPPSGSHTHVEANETIPKKSKKRASLADAKKRITHATKHKKTKSLTAKQHFKSLLFGFSLGGLVLLIILFGFFNERFIAPFITPSKSVSSTPIIIDPNASTSIDKPLAIVPKINVEVPVVYNIDSIQEDAIQTALEDGVVHYATTPKPGEKGNSVIVGHSSNNIFNSGKYKFAFVLLSKLEEGDTFSLTRDGKRYVYRVFEKKVVRPDDISVLGPADRESTATLITCDPPGTSINRLIVIGEQISPEPAKNTESSVTQTAQNQPSIVPGNAPSLWSRFTEWLTG